MYSRAYVEITNICNKNCSFCPGTRRRPHSMTMEEFTAVCAQLKGLTQYLYFHIMGEPTLHPLLPDFIRHASAEGFKVAITTNGSLLESRGDALIEAGVYKVNVSVHSFEDGTTEDYLHYINSCYDFADKASRAGVLTILRLWNKGGDEHLNARTEELLHEHFPEDWAYGKRGVRLHDKLHLEYGERFEWPDLSAADYGDEVFCYGLKDHFGVLCDGTVVPCCLDHEGDIPLGNLHEMPLADILKSPRALAMREGFTRRKACEELCRRCGYARRFSIKK